MLTKHIQQSDLIITTAAIPGQGVAEAHQQGAGRRHEGRRRDRRSLGRRRRQLRGHAARRDGCRSVTVTIVAPLNVPSLLGEDASELYAKNQYNLLALMLKDNIIKIDWDDEVLAKTVLTHAGKMQAMTRASQLSRQQVTEPAAKRSRASGVSPTKDIAMDFSITITGFVASTSSCSPPLPAGSSSATCRRSCTRR